MATLIKIVKAGEAALARRQANELLEERSGRSFGYRADKTIAQNRDALQMIDEWWKTEGAASRSDSQGVKLQDRP